MGETMKRTSFLFFLFFLSLMGDEQARVLVGCFFGKHVYMSEQFFCMLRRLERGNIVVNYHFIGDCAHAKKNAALIKQATVQVVPVAMMSAGEYEVQCKNDLIHLARNQGYDFLFLLDAPICLHKKTLLHLMAQKKDIIGEICYARNKQKLVPTNVWLQDDGHLYTQEMTDELSKKDVKQRSDAFCAQLHDPGVYEVGGVDHCVLMSRKVLSTDIGFSPIYNLTFKRVGVHFCLRAMALAFDLFVDSKYPAVCS